MNIKIKRLAQNAKTPSQAKPCDAGCDLTAVSIIEETAVKITYGFGLAFEIPEGYAGFIFPRSSVRDTGLMLSNCVGVIDSGYRGEVRATFYKADSMDSKPYKVGDRIAQIVFLQVPKTVIFECVDELSATVRGDGGFGHTGEK